MLWSRVINRWMDEGLLDGREREALIIIIEMLPNTERSKTANMWAPLGWGGAGLRWTGKKLNLLWVNNEGNLRNHTRKLMMMERQLNGWIEVWVWRKPVTRLLLVVRSRIDVCCWGEENFFFFPANSVQQIVSSNRSSPHLFCFQAFCCSSPRRVLLLCCFFFAHFQ